MSPTRSLTLRDESTAFLRTTGSTSRLEIRTTSDSPPLYAYWLAETVEPGPGPPEGGQPVELHRTGGTFLDFN
ncbi:MAG: hypothetical protein JSU71_08355, partial [Betaproteobacteria bacterium]